MAVPFSNTKLRVPQGFQSLLEGVAKEVLQMQPNDIFAFSAVYFENLLQLRESGVVDPVTHMSRTQDRMYNNKAFQKPDVDVNNEEHQDAAIKIQTKYRQHQSKAVVDQMRQDKAATKIQAGIRGYLGRRRVSNLREEMGGSSRRSVNAEDGNDLEELAQEDEFNINEDEEETARTELSVDPETTTRMTALPATPSEAVQPSGKDEEEIDIDLGDPEVQKAAVLIQSGFRGLKSRRKPLPPPPSSPIPQPSPSPVIIQASTMTQMNSVAATPSEDVQPDAKETEEIDIDLGDPEVQKAAAFIQSGFRGLKARRKPTPQPTPPPPSPPATIQTTAKVEPEETSVPKSPVNEEDGDINFDLNDPEVQSAATKIQAGFRGMRTRQHLKPRQNEESKDNVDEDLTARDEVEELDDVEPREEETERRETPNAKLEISGVQGDSAQEDESPELEFSEDDPETIKAIEEIQGSFRRLKDEDENEDEVIESNEQENLEMETAATKIQAGFKGMKLRKELKEKKLEKKVINEDPKEIQPEEETDAGNLATEENSDSDLTAAANKIQAGFRGYKTRKEVQRLRRKKTEDLVSEEEMKDEHKAEENINNNEDEEKRVVAASKIQAGFKGYKTRREVEVRRKQKAKVNEEEKEEGHEEHVEDEEKQMEEGGEKREQEPETQEKEDEEDEEEEDNLGLF